MIVENQVDHPNQNPSVREEVVEIIVNLKNH